MDVAAALTAALAHRDKELRLCPFRKGSTPPYDEPCSQCAATVRGPCWINVGADAAFVDTAREILATL